MNRAIPPLLALLLVLSMAVAPAMADTEATPGTLSDESPQNQLSSTAQADGSLQTAPNTTNRLSLEETARSEYAEFGPDLGATLTGTDEELRIDHTQYTTIDRQFDDASTDEQRRLLQDAYDRLKERSDALETREQQAVRTHANGELSTDQLLQTLLRNHREAAAISESFDELAKRTGSVSNTSLPIEDEQDKLEIHRTEIRSQLEAAADGHSSAADMNYITVETSENGFVLSTMGEKYVREAARFDNREASRSNQFDDILEAYEHASELYPWAYETVQSPSFHEYTTVNLYLIDNDHAHGHLGAYLDGATGNIYREVQVLEQNSLPNRSGSGKTAVKNGTRIGVEQTQGNGPDNVTVRDSETGDSQSTTISINGFEIGETGADGSLWYAPPKGEYELTVETSTTRHTNVTVSNN